MVKWGPWNPYRKLGQLLWRYTSEVDSSSSSSLLELARLCGDYGLALLKRPPNTASKLSLKPHFFIQLSEQREILESAITLPLYPPIGKEHFLSSISFPNSLSWSSLSLQCFLIIPKIFCYGVFTAFKAVKSSNHWKLRMSSKLEMSQQQEQQPEKWKGMFGRLKNCRGNRKR